MSHRFGSRTTAIALALAGVLSVPSVAYAETGREISQEEGSVVAFSATDKETLNRLWLSEEGVPLPDSVYGAKTDEAGNVVLVQEDGSPAPIAVPRSVPGKAWKATKCAAVITVNVVPATAAVKKFGSVAKLAKFLSEAGSKASAAEKLGAAGAAILDVDEIVDTCGRDWGDA